MRRGLPRRPGARGMARPAALFAALLAGFVLTCAAQADSLRLVFVGDVMLDDGPGRTIAAGGDPLGPFAAELRDADFTLGNLECPIAESGSALDNKLFAFRAHPRVIEVLRGRLDAVSLANNHSGDFGKAAFVETMDRLDAAGIPYFGGGRELAAAHRPLWIERKGLRIAVLGTTSTSRVPSRPGRTGRASPGARTATSSRRSAPRARPAPTW